MAGFYGFEHGLDAPFFPSSRMPGLWKPFASIGSGFGESTAGKPPGGAPVRTRAANPLGNLPLRNLRNHSAYRNRAPGDFVSQICLGHWNLRSSPKIQPAFL